jgi:PAS domain S-box-containing protein
MNKADLLSMELLFAKSDLIFFSIDLEYKYINFSQKHFQVMKLIWGSEITVGKSILDVITKDEDRIKAKSNFDRAILAQEPFIVEEYYGDEFLHRSYYQDKYIPLIENGTVIGVLITVEEVHNSQEKQMFEQIVNLTKSGVTLSDASKKDNPLIYVNNAFVEMTGYEKSEVIGKNCRFLQKNDREQEARYILKKAIENKESCEVEFRNYKKDGTLFYNLLILSPIFDSSGILLYFVGIQNDITAIKQSNEINFQKRRTELIANLIGNISHQWRQPLSLISTLSSALQLQEEKGSLNKDNLVTYTNKIIETTQYLSNILKNFGDFLIHDAKSQFYIYELLEDIVRKKNDVGIRLVVDRDIKIVNYKNLLSKAIEHLIENAETALANSEEKCICIDVKKEKDKIIITIKDNGGGIDEKILPSIFDPYMTTKHQSQGVGLGLYLTQTFLFNVEGTISIQNIEFDCNEKLCKGTIVTLVLKIEF